MKQLKWQRILLSLAAGYLVASNLNWAVAEFLLNPWAMPLFDGFMRTGDDGGGGINVLKMTAGFLLPQVVSVALLIALPRPAGWVRRALVATGLTGLAAFFGTYTFLSGWGNVNWVPLMGAAVADTACIGVGTLISGWLMREALRSGQRT